MLINNSNIYNEPQNLTKRPGGTLKFLIYMYILWIPVVQVWKLSIDNTPMFSVFFIIMSSICFLNVLVYGLLENKKLYTGFMVFGLIAWYTSVMNDMTPTASLYNDFLYLTPILFFILTEFVQIELKAVCRVVQYMTVIAGIVSMLIYLGVIDSGLNYNISITLVDNTIGLIGLAVSIYLLAGDNKKTFSWITLVMAVVVLVTGQSRARVVLGLVIIVLSVFYVLFIKKGGKSKSFFAIICVFVVVYFFVDMNSDAINQYLGFLFDKFENFEDSSFEYRIEEMKVHLELFNEKPLFGIGCGALNGEYNTRIDTHLYGHNMFTAVLAANGVFYFLFFAAIYLMITIRVIKLFFQQATPENFLALLLVSTLAVLSISSSGFAKPTTHIMMLVIGTVLNNKIPNQ